MNTTEIKISGKIDSFDKLWEYAEKQFLSYEKLEGIPDWKKHDFSIDCSDDQMRFKDMLQIRCIEELTEATHALDNTDHFFEEVTDSLNFFLSAYIMAGFDLSSMEHPLRMREYRLYEPSYEICCEKFYRIVDDIGDLCNLLKNRPWAQSNYLVSMKDFDDRANTLWEDFWKMIWNFIPNEMIVFELFERKYEVNKWRIRTGY